MGSIGLWVYIKAVVLSSKSTKYTYKSVWNGNVESAINIALFNHLLIFFLYFSNCPNFPTLEIYLQVKLHICTHIVKLMSFNKILLI